ncbi:MAG TPA: glycosyltransferase family 4 protein [Gemmatimonadaceae bacterium]|nr:glycosyltransferase family 4 protein [Gemmatimonadaceae bacterium]
MKLLFVASRFPYPPFNGDQVRAYHHLRVLSRRHEIVLVAPEPTEHPAACLEAIAPFCAHVEVVPTSRVKAIARLARAPFERLPLQTLVFYEPEIGRRAAALARSSNVDLVHVQMIRMAPAIQAIGNGLPCVVDLIDSMSVNLSRQAQRSRAPKSWLAAWEARRVERYERELIAQFDQLVISSPLDRTAIGAYENLHVVANGVDLAAHPFVTTERTPNSLVFSGTMWYFPNVDAAQWLVHEVLPLVRREIADTTLTIVGARPLPVVKRLGDVPGVTVTGRVPSVHEYVARAAVAVAPMRSGSGIQFKIIEAMATGTPVVATPTATVGLRAVAERDLLVGEGAEGFAAQVVRVLRDSELRRQLAQQALELVREVYAWERTVDVLESVYERARDGRNSAASPAAVPVGSGS